MEIIFLILIGLAVHAGDILTNYRENGISQIEMQMDHELGEKEYWNN